MVGISLQSNKDLGLTLKQRNQTIPIAFKCQKSSLDFYGRVKFHREVDGAAHYDQVIDECKRKSYRKLDIGQDEMKKEFVNAPHWSTDKWISVLAKEKRKGFNVA